MGKIKRTSRTSRLETLSWLTVEEEKHKKKKYIFGVAWFNLFFFPEMCSQVMSF